jgi:chromate transporter
MTAHTTPPQVSYTELARLFIRLSLSAFGGPVAHIAIAEDEIVARRKWLSRQHFLDLVAATNLIPGPNSTETMIHVGYVLRGIPGALLTGACFIIPSFLLTLALAVVYVNTGNIPQVGAILWGIKPVILAIIAQVGYRLVRSALKTPVLWALFLASAAVIAFTPMPEVVVMLASGVLYAVYQTGLKPGNIKLAFFAGAHHALPLQHPLLWLQTAEAAGAGLGDLFFYFLKIGSVLFGSGYILIAYIQQDVVNAFGWLTTRQLLDAVAIGQITPGPVSTTVAVIGYIVHGAAGAVLATLGIFLPSFVLVILTAPLIPRMRQSQFLSAFLAGVNAGVIAAILVTLLDLAGAAFLTLSGDAVSPVALALGLGALVLLVRTAINATWLIVIGGLVGLAVSLIA